MRVRSCETFWLLKNGLLHTYPSLRTNVTCDILVVGGGITGALMAWQFASEGYDTILIDRGDVSLGSTSATTALLQYEIDEPMYALTGSVGAQVAEDCYLGGIEAIRSLDELIAQRGIQCEFELRASLYVAHNRRERSNLQKEIECRQSAGIEVEWVSEADLMSSYGVRGYGAIRSKVAASLDGYCLAHALLEDASVHFKLRIFDHTEIEGIAYHDNGNDIHIKGGWNIHCRKLIFATGYETLSFLKDKVADLISTYACVSEPMNNIPVPLRENLFWTTNDPYLYLRTTADNRILVGGCDVPFRNAKRRDALIEKKEAELVSQLKYLIPSLDIIPDFTWAGTFGVTKDALPYIGPHADYPNSYFVLGFGGNGITFSVMAMKILSDAVGGRSNRFIDYFRFGR